MKHACLLLFVLITFTAQTQTDMAAPELPYYEIPAYPETYSPENVAARMIDGLGYRYYWATGGLTEEDLAYKPSEDGRTTAETIDHLYGLSRTIVNATKQQPNMRPSELEELTFAEQRQRTLENLKTASDLLKASGEKTLEDYPIIFQRGDQKAEYPFWNMINGPIADALYHTGQVVSYRRSSGNPMDPRVNVFMGRNRE